MQFKTKSKDQTIKVLWPEESVYKATGGFTLDKTLLKTGTDFLEKGALMAVNFTTRTANLVKTAIVNEIAAIDAVVYKVGKNHHFKVGDKLGKTVGGKAYSITIIDTSNESYDSITVGTTIGAVAVGDVLFESSTTGATAAAEANVANGILIHNVELEDFTTINVGFRIYEIQEAKLPYGVTSYNKVSLTSRFHFI